MPTILYKDRELALNLHEAGEHVSDQIRAAGTFYELELLEALGPIRGTVLDIGANIGNHALYFALQGADVHAFEPHPANYALLLSNLMQNGFYRARCHMIALGDQVMSIGMTTDPRNMGAITVMPHGGVVPMLTLDLYAAQHDLSALSLIKLDVEGYEARVLQGGLEALRRLRPDIIAEHNDSQSAYDCMQLLEPLGYVITKILNRPNPMFLYVHREGGPPGR
jgi:FkbM family methyltransferase